MLVKQEQISPCEVELHIEVEVEKVKAATNSTYSELAKTTNIPGFRKGKAPRVILEQFLDRERVMDRVADKLMKDAYPEALEESKVEPYAPADVEVVSMEFDAPMVFKARIPLPPKVELGEYVGLTAERVIPKIEDADVEAEITKMLERQAEYTPVTDRKLKKGDTALVEMTDLSEADAEPKRNVVQVGENLPDFDKGLVGMKIDDEKTIEVTYPEDHASEELRGETRGIQVKLIEIHERKLPELNDEWVVKNFTRTNDESEETGEEEKTEDPADRIDTVDKLKARIREAMEGAAREQAENDVRNTLVEKLVAGSTVHIPDVMIEEAVHDRFESLQESLKKRKVTVENYMDYLGKTYDELHETYAQESRRALATTLVFREIMEKENITVEDADYEEAIAAMAAEQGVPPATMSAYVDSTDSGDTVRNRVLRKKIVDFVVHASNIKNTGATGAKSEGKKTTRSKAAK